MDGYEKRDHKIYKYTNKVNGKVYIGQTCKTLNARACKDGKGYKRCTLFWKAIQKYGWNNFEGAILEDNLSAKEATERELYFIEIYDSTNVNKGYNILSVDYQVYSNERRNNGRNSKLGIKLSEELKKKLSDSHKGIKPSRESIEKMIKSKIGKPCPEEVKKKISEAHKGMKHTEETKKKISDLNKGRKHTEETKKKMSASHKGKKMKDSTKEKLRKIKTGSVTSEEVRRKQSLAKKGKYVGENSPRWGRKHTKETKEKLSQANKGKRHTEEAKKKIREAALNRSAWNKGKKLTEEQKKNFGKNCKGSNSPNSRKVTCVETGEEYYNMKYTAMCLGVSVPRLRRAIKNNRLLCNYHWKFTDGNEYIQGTKIICIETGVIYRSITEASCSINFTASAIYSSLKFGYTAGGYHWKYYTNN